MLELYHSLRNRGRLITHLPMIPGSALYNFIVLLFQIFQAKNNFENWTITGTKISESTYSVFLFSMAFGWGPPWRSFLTSTASALTMRSIWEVQGASHDPGGGVDTTAVLAGNSNLYLSEIFSPVTFLGVFEIFVKMKIWREIWIHRFLEKYRWENLRKLQIWISRQYCSGVYTAPWVMASPKGLTTLT